jgi:lipopolysaccharide export system protein LptA
MSWQKPARIGVAVIGIASAIAVYLAMGERRATPAPRPITRTDDKAIVEFSDTVTEHFFGDRKDLELKDAKFSAYRDGSVKLSGESGNFFTILFHKGESRVIEIRTREAKISKDENYFDLTGPVKLLDSDGFWLETDRATINRADSIFHVPGAATFGKGRMTGSGVGFSYDETRQVLLISQKARIKTVDEAGKPVMEMTAGTGMLDRLQHVTTLDTNVHVVRNNQIIDTDAANGRLSPDNDVVTYVELHGNARVTGGTSIESMTARDISLDYTEDGKTLEAVKMVGGANVAMTGDAGKPGRKIAGEQVLDLTLAADGMLTSAMARENVRLDLPAAAGTPQRNITAQTLDGTGEAGKGLTRVTFTRDVSFIESPLPSKTGPADKRTERTARSQKLEASMANDAVTAATFTGDVTFEETGLKGCAAQADYQPQKETLALSGETKAGKPILAEEQSAIESMTIEVALETRQMKARGGVIFKRGPGTQRCRPASGRPPGEQGASNVPKLLKSDQPMTITAPSLDYDSGKGIASFFDGSVVLSQQPDTSIIARDSMVIDQTKGDLSATGDVRSSLMLDNKKSTGSGYELRYIDAKRLITYTSAPTATADEVSLTSPDSTIRAGSIDLTLAEKENTLKGMNARKNIRLTEGSHKVDGGATLVYTAKDEKYVVTSDGATPVVVITLSPTCREQLGGSVTFWKGTDRADISAGVFGGASKPSTSGCTPSTRK